VRIVDYGWSSFLWLFPSLFIREADLEMFGEWAHTWTAESSSGPLHCSRSSNRLARAYAIRLGYFLLGWIGSVTMLTLVIPADFTALITVAKAPKATFSSART